MLSIARTRLALPAQLVFLIINALALLLGLIYNHKTPELYANNVHSKIGWIITWIASAWVFMALIQLYAARAKPYSLEDHSGQPLNVENMARYQRVSETEPRWSNDSGQGTERNSASLYSNSNTVSPSVESEDQRFDMPLRRHTHDDLDEVDLDAEKSGLLRNNALDHFLTRSVARFVTDKPLRYLRFIYVVIDRTILIQGFVAIMAGTVVYGGIGVSVLVNTRSVLHTRGVSFSLFREGQRISKLLSYDCQQEHALTSSCSTAAPFSTYLRITSKAESSSDTACSR